MLQKGYFPAFAVNPTDIYNLEHSRYLYTYIKEGIPECDSEKARKNTAITLKPIYDFKIPFILYILNELHSHVNYPGGSSCSCSPSPFITSYLWLYSLTDICLKKKSQGNSYSWAENITQHIYPPPDEPGGRTSGQKVLKTPTAQFMLHSVSSNENGCISLSLLYNHSTVPVHNAFHTNPLQTKPLQDGVWHKKSNRFNVRIQLLFFCSVSPRAPLPFLLCTLVWLVSGFYLHLLRPPYFSLINV